MFGRPMLFWRIAVLATATVLLGTSPSPSEAAAPRLATFQSDVTIPVGEMLYVKPLTTVEHPLLAKGVVIEDGAARYVLCAVDWCTLRNDAYDRFRDKIAEAAETVPSRVAVQCVHQHTAPSFDAGAERLLREQDDAPQHRSLEVLEEITDRLAAAVRASLAELQPFDRVGVGQAEVERVASARRVFDAEGVLHTRWSACRDEKLRAMPEGDVDTMIKTITLARGDRPLVRMHYYATHPQTYYRDGRASYDFPGMARQRLEEEEGVFQVYFTGCAGDVTAGKYNRGTPEDRAALAERLLAGMKASIAATAMAEVDEIAWCVVPTRLEPRTDGSRDPAKCRATLEDPEAKAEDRAGAASRLACYQRLQEPVELTSLAIGPARVVHLPGEPMNFFQLYAQQVLPHGFVAVAGYGLSTPGYVCTEASYEEGGYEPSASALVPQAEAAVKQAIRQLLGVE